jgi:hypothetical protein
MVELIVHTPQNEDSSRYRYYNIFFKNFINFLKTKFIVEEDTYFEYANIQSYPVKLLNNDSSSDLLECEMIIENKKTKEFFVLSVSDNLTGTILNHQSNPLCKKILVAQYNEKTIKNHLRGDFFEKFEPWIYFPSNEFDLDGKFQKRKEIETYIDKFCFWGTSMEDRKILSHFNPEIFDGGLPIGNFDSYSDTLIQYKMALSIAGRAEFCYRDIENFGMGIPIIRFEYENKMSVPLVPNYHYISIKRPDNLVYDRLGEKEHAELIEKRFFEVKDDYEFLNFISKNARNYYENNLSPEGSITSTYYQLGLNEWLNDGKEKLKKIISFSLYNSNPENCNGILCNLELSKIIYPDWICRIYYSNEVPIETIEKISHYENVELILINETEKFPEISKFLSIDDDDVEVMIVRDTDSRLSYREKSCVDEFLNSNFTTHSIRDNISHTNMNSGLWGIKKNDKIKIKDLYIKLYSLKEDGNENEFKEIVYSYYEDSCLIHCSNYLNTFPVEKTNDFFVGDKWPADNFGKPSNFIFF